MGVSFNDFPIFGLFYPSEVQLQLDSEISTSIQLSSPAGTSRGSVERYKVLFVRRV